MHSHKHFPENHNPVYYKLDSSNSSKTQEPQKSSEWWLNTSLREELRFYFHEYLEHAADQKVLLRDTETKKGYYLPYTTRYDGNYGNITGAKLRHIEFKYGVLLTLTLDPRRYKNIAEATTAL